MRLLFSLAAILFGSSSFAGKGPPVSRLTLCKIALVCVSFVLLPFAAAQHCSVRGGTVQLRDILPSGDPLLAQNLTFDATFAGQAIEYVRSNDPNVLTHMANSPAIAHVLNHARNFDYDVPKDSPEALVANLLGPQSKQPARAAVCEQSIKFFCGPMLSDPHWVADTLRYLPADFRFQGTLFLTFGYDIGVAFAPNASLNCTHAHFDNHPRELLYYAIHELHHVGFMTYQKPPRLADIKTCADLLRLVEYSTQLEGMAVLAAYQRRRDDHALGDDADYVALQDQKRMKDDLAAYLKDYDYLKRRGTQPADADAWAVIDRMSSGERIWYRAGAYMAQRIEAANGHAALVELVKQGPARFLSTYESLPATTTPPPRTAALQKQGRPL
jgi:hypothetical protein